MLLFHDTLLKIFGKVLKYTMLARVLGFTFAVKLMEKGEENAQEEYALLAEAVPESIQIRAQEEEHEQSLLGMLDEERLQYVGSMVLGLNDALVELTGSLAGFRLRPAKQPPDRPVRADRGNLRHLLHGLQ